MMDGRDHGKFINAKNKNSYNDGIMDKRAGPICTSSSPNDVIKKKFNNLTIGDQQDVQDLKGMKSHKDVERIKMIQEYIDKSSLQKLYPSLRQQSLRVQVIYFVKQLREGSLGCHACVYGSTSLKTFLPDGDIDFTLLGPFEDTDITSKVKFLLDMEAKRPNSRIAQVKLINAKVKVVKCNVNGIDVDLSSNQLMGMGATTFYEYAGERFKKDHLFKRSIILIKAWCSYRERPILGSSKRLLSTSALNVMVFYVINAFYDELTGPFSVLYRFISYYGEFMWENNILSVKGPKIGAKVDGLISDREIDSIVWNLTRGRKTKGHFPQNFINIEDPLCPSNNLGTSVNHQDNFKTIKQEFEADKNILREFLSSEADVTDELINECLVKVFQCDLKKTSFEGDDYEAADLSGQYQKCLSRFDAARTICSKFQENRKAFRHVFVLIPRLGVPPVHLLLSTDRFWLCLDGIRYRYPECLFFFP